MADFVDYFGYDHCIRLENENTKVILTPQCGGRVLEYSWNGENSIYLDPSQRGWVYRPNNPVIDPCGGRFDIGPEMTIPPHPDLWYGEWRGEITDQRAARLISVSDKPTGTQLIREFELGEHDSKLVCTQTIRNVSDETKTWCHWGRTLVKGGGMCVIPLSENSHFPNKYVMYGRCDSLPGRLLICHPEDPQVKVQNNYLIVTGTPRFPKLGIDSYAGWFSYLLRNNLMFVKHFPAYSERIYNEITAFTIAIWYFKDTICELEPLGPMENIAPGKSVTFVEEWSLLPFDFPQRNEDINTEEIARKVSTIKKNSN